MAPTPSAKSNQPHTVLKTPQSKHRLNFNAAKPSPNPHNAIKEAPPGEHPVEVIGRIRDHPDRKDSKAQSILQINHETQTLRVRAEFGYRDFSLDGVSLSEEEDLDAFYKKFVESRINDVKMGAKCTIMMYGPTGSGKSHTMFGCSKQPGIVYRSLKDILGDGEEFGIVTFVHVTVLEIYNEEIYDLLSSNGGGGLGFGWPKGSASKVRLEVMGKKAKNATYISGNEAGKISKEIQKVEKRRIVKSTLCNERSSRSHCMIILDVPTVGGRLMLVDMAGSENIEQAGQIGLEAKMQTGKINQGNIALKRVVESIANGDSHVPFRDSKLTMLLQDSFEDDKSKILMILCASPDPKEIHKTISTLEYGAKAKCIVRGPHTPVKDKFGEDASAAEGLGSRIAAMDQFIYKLQMENKLREKERNEAHKELMKKEQEVAALRGKIQKIEGKGTEVNEEEINMKVNERTKLLRLELEKKLEECQRMANEFVENERRRMEEKILQQQQEVEMLRRRLEEIESQFLSRDGKARDSGQKDMDGSSFAKKLLGMYADEDPGMVKSMDLDMGDQETYTREVKLIAGNSNCIQILPSQPILSTTSNDIPDCGVFGSKFGDRVCLSTVFEEEEVEETSGDEEVEKGIIEEKRVCSSTPVDNSSPGTKLSTSYFNPSPERFLLERVEEEAANDKDSATDRRMRIQNIFTLCGNHRELSQHTRTPRVEKRDSENVDPNANPTTTVNEDAKSPAILLDSIKGDSGTKVFEARAIVPKENFDPSSDSGDAPIEVLVKWEASKENPGKFITTLRVVKEATLADLRKLIEIYLGADNQAFTFLVLGDPSGAPVSKDKETTLLASSLPVCNNQLRSHLACLRPGKGLQSPNPMPLSPLENKLPLTPISHLTSPKVAKTLSPVPLATLSPVPLITATPHFNLIA